MDPVLLTKRAKLQTPSKTAVPGLLRISASAVKWQASEAGTEPDISMALSTITKPQRSKGKPFLRLVSGGSAYVFEFESEAERDLSADYIAKGPQQQDVDLLPLPEREALLKGDVDLKEEYELVKAGVLREAEFWSGKKQQLAAKQGAGGGAKTAAAAAAAASKAPVAGSRTGIPNKMLNVQGEQDARMAAVGKSKVNFNLTPEMITQIYAERPHIKLAFKKNVPHNMSEREFWTRYTRHMMAKDVRRKRLLGGVDVEDIPDDHAELFRAGAYFGSGGAGAEAVYAAAAAGRTKRLKLGRVDPVINLLAHLHDGFTTGHGVAHDPSREGGGGFDSSSIADDLIQDINRHAEVVLAGVDAMAAAAAEENVMAPSASSSAAGGAAAGDAGALAELTPSERALIYHREGTALEDLRALPEEHFEVLSIGDASRYFDRLPGQEAAATSAASSSTVPTRLAALSQISAVDPYNLSWQVLDPRLAYQVLLECSRGSSVGAAAGAGAGASRPPEDVLAPELLAMIRCQVLAANELSRHFWACVPPNTAAKVEKVERLHKEADKRYDQVESMWKIASGPERSVIRQLLRPVTDLLDKLIERYKQDQALRSSQAFGRL